jgi:hypothetical protein
MEVTAKLRREMQDYCFKLKAEIDSSFETQAKLKNSLSKQEQFASFVEEKKLQFQKCFNEIDEKFLAFSRLKQVIALQSGAHFTICCHQIIPFVRNI